MTERRGANADDRGVHSDEIDRLFDREHSPLARRDLIRRLRRDPAAVQEVVETDRLVRLLRQPVETPDLTERVLRGVDRRRGFLSPRLRRRVRQGRAAVAAGGLLVLFTLALARRYSPDTFRLTPAETPVADLGRAVMEDSAEGRRVLDGVVDRLEPVRLVEHDSLPAGSLGLAEFHVETVGTDLPRRIVLRPSDDADVVTVRVSWSVVDVPSISAAFDTVSPEMLLENPSLRAFGSVALLAAGFEGDGAPSFGGGGGSGSSGGVPGVARGVVPLSMPRGASAYVGRLDPFRDAELKTSQPDR